MKDVMFLWACLAFVDPKAMRHQSCVLKRKHPPSQSCPHIFGSLNGQASTVCHIFPSLITPACCAASRIQHCSTPPAAPDEGIRKCVCSSCPPEPLLSPVPCFEMCAHAR